MFTWTWIVKIVLFDAFGAVALSSVHIHGPLNTTTCEEFERNARFNPYAVIDTTWKIFYFWANTTELNPIIFNLPAKNKLLKFREVVESIEPDLQFEWHKAVLIMQPRIGIEVVLLDAGTPGAFRAVIKQEQRIKVRPHREPLLKLADVRIKIIEPYLGMMCCEDLTAYALARINAVPTTEEKCVAAAAIIGYRGPNGQSYINLTRRRVDDEL